MIVGALAAGQAAAASLVVILVPVVLAWATASYSQAPWGQALQVGVGLWLLAHHAGIVIPGGHVGLVPLGALAVPLVTCWFAGVRLARAMDPNAAAIRAGIGRHRPVLPPPRAMVALTLTYAGLVTLVGVLATTAGIRPLVIQAFAGSALISGIGATAGVGAWIAGGVLAGIRRLAYRWRLPVVIRRCLWPVALAVIVQLAGGLVLFLLALGLGWDRMLVLQHALAPGIAGGLVLAVGQLAAVPNAVIWAGSYAAGPGFAVGTGTSVTPGHTQLGALPAVPLLGALPAPGAVPGWTWAVLALPVLAGLLAGWWVARSEIGTAAETLRQAALVALLTGLVWTGLSWLSGGPAGPGRLAQIGPSGWQVGLAVTVEVGAGALLAAGAGLIARYISAREDSGVLAREYLNDQTPPDPLLPL
jgi:hypothetical protein